MSFSFLLFILFFTLLTPRTESIKAINRNGTAEVGRATASGLKNSVPVVAECSTRRVRADFYGWPDRRLRNWQRSRLHGRLRSMRNHCLRKWRPPTPSDLAVLLENSTRSIHGNQPNVITVSVEFSFSFFFRATGWKGKSEKTKQA